MIQAVCRSNRQSLMSEIRTIILVVLVLVLVLVQVRVLVLVVESSTSTSTSRLFNRDSKKLSEVAPGHAETSSVRFCKCLKM